MSRILTQEEVDALLGVSFEEENFEAKAAPSGPSQTSGDFSLSAPPLAAGRRLERLEEACERIAPVLAAELTQILASEELLEAKFGGISQLPSRELLGGLAEGSAVGLVENELSHVIGALSLQPDLTGLVLDRLQGGSIDSVAPRSRVSEIDRALLRVTLARVLRALDRSLDSISMKLSDVDAEPASGQLACRGGTLCAARFSVTRGEGRYDFDLLLTADLARALAGEAGAKASEILDPHFLKELGKVEVQSRAVIDGVTLHIGEIESLAEGKVLQLGVPETSPVGVEINGHLFARGVIRSSGGQRAVEVLEFVAETAGAAQAASQGEK